MFTTMRALMGVAPWSSLHISQMFSPAVIGWQIWCWLIYWIILGGIQAYQYYQRYMNSELRLETAGAQLQRGTAECAAHAA